MLRQVLRLVRRRLGLLALEALATLALRLLDLRSAPEEVVRGSRTKVAGCDAAVWHAGLNYLLRTCM